MPLFRGNIPVKVTRSSGSDLYGQPTDRCTRLVKAQVIKFLDNSTQTPLRQEMSASHGRLDEEVAAAVILFPPDFDIRMDDIVEVFKVTLVVDGVWPRSNTLGQIHHQRAQLHRKQL